MPFAAFGRHRLVCADGFFRVAQVGTDIAELPVSQRTQETADRHRAEAELGGQRLCRFKRQLVQMFDQIFGNLALGRGACLHGARQVQQQLFHQRLFYFIIIER